jgi:chromosome segregation ATPase
MTEPSKVGMSISPSIDEKLDRHGQRIKRLEVAIADEKNKADPSQKRIEKLSAEISRRKSEVNVIIEKAKQIVEG